MMYISALWFKGSYYVVAGEKSESLSKIKRFDLVAVWLIKPIWTKNQIWQFDSQMKCGEELCSDFSSRG